ncbi:hypothetical protein [Geothrix sp. 21YS21S-2]|uniref:hypothetical protein n=1 Tax=Geothrix sp. 21YS21S-2 TaxID=3068893 RepID=UPI0027B8CE6E|nr:hypothetical protein [Geothrix sp. 21YS21S-2]
MLPGEVIRIVVEQVPPKALWEKIAQFSGLFTLFTGCGAIFAIYNGIRSNREQKIERQKREDADKPILVLKDNLTYQDGLFNNIAIRFELENIRNKPLNNIRYVIFEIMKDGKRISTDATDLETIPMYGKIGRNEGSTDILSNKVLGGNKSSIAIIVRSPRIRYKESNVEIVLIVEAEGIDGLISRGVYFIHYAPNSKMLTNYMYAKIRTIRYSGKSEFTDMPSMLYCSNGDINPIVNVGIEKYFEKHINTELLSMLSLVGLIKVVGSGRRMRPASSRKMGKTSKRQVASAKINVIRLGDL